HQTTRVGSTTELKRFTVRQFQPIKRRSPNFLEAAVAKVGNGSTPEAVAKCQGRALRRFQAIARQTAMPAFRC
ncbi:hypothetical protein, partial [Xanthobacter agilis]